VPKIKSSKSSCSPTNLQTRSRKKSKIPSVIDITDLQKIPSPKSSEWWIERFLRVGDVGYLYGPAGVGKNFFLIDMLLHMSRGKPFLGKYKTEFAKVLYLSYEDSIERWKRRVQEIIQGYDWGSPPSDLIKIIPKETLQRKRFDLFNERHRGLLERTLEENQIEILVLDPWLRMVSPDFEENATEHVTHRLFPVLNHLNLKHHVTIILVDHVGWSHGHVRGSSAKEGCSDFQIRLTSPQTNRLTVQVKGNDYEQFNVTLERSERDSGQPKHTLVVEKQKSKTKKRKRMALDAVWEALWAGCQTNQDIQKETGYCRTTVWRSLKDLINQGKARRKENNRYEPI